MICPSHIWEHVFWRTRVPNAVVFGNLGVVTRVYPACIPRINKKTNSLVAGLRFPVSTVGGWVCTTLHGVRGVAERAFRRWTGCCESQVHGVQCTVVRCFVSQIISWRVGGPGVTGVRCVGGACSLVGCAGGVSNRHVCVLLVCE